MEPLEEDDHSLNTPLFTLEEIYTNDLRVFSSAQGRQSSGLRPDAGLPSVEDTQAFLRNPTRLIASQRQSGFSSKPTNPVYLLDASVNIAPDICDPSSGVCIPSTLTAKEGVIHELSVEADDLSKDGETKRWGFGLFGLSSKYAAEPVPISDSSGCEDFSCVDIESALGKSYIDMSRNHFESNALDVLALYIKGQKLLYTEAKTYCEQQLNFLMLPAIFISCVGSIFSFLSGSYTSGPVIIASLNGFNAFLLALISYLKLDAKAQAHKTSAYKFEKIESTCEFNSGRFLFFETNIDDIRNAVNKIETDVREIKETNQFILPESIRFEFAFTYTTNVFMLVKKNQSVEIMEMNKLRNCIEYIGKLKAQLSVARGNKDNALVRKLVGAINSEETRKAVIVRKIMECRKRYFDLDEKFNKEINRHIKRSNKWFITRVLCCDWLKS